jgi:hypothetical protein
MSPDSISKSGLALLIVAAVWSNVVVYKMAKMVGVEWYLKSDKKSLQVIRLYRDRYKDGPLHRQLQTAYCVAGLGGAVIIAGSFLKWM